MIATTTTEKPKSRSGIKPKTTGQGVSTMTSSLHQNKSATNCQLENVRQESAVHAKRVIQKPTPTPRMKAVSKGTSTAAVLKKTGSIQHSDQEDEEETEDIHPALLKQTRKSGSLNL